MAKASNPNFMNGIPEMLVLRLEREMYGYELVGAIRAATGDEIKLGEGVVYPTLHALEHDGHLASRRKSAGGRTRIYYRLTRKGQRRLAQTTSEWQRLTQAVARAIGEGTHAKPAV